MTKTPLSDEQICDLATDAALDAGMPPKFMLLNAGKFCAFARAILKRAPDTQVAPSPRVDFREIVHASDCALYLRPDRGICDCTPPVAPSPPPYPDMPPLPRPAPPEPTISATEYYYRAPSPVAPDSLVARLRRDMAIFADNPKVFVASKADVNELIGRLERVKQAADAMREEIAQKSPAADWWPRLAMVAAEYDAIRAEKDS